MASFSFRFLHAADFRLDLPVYGLADVPEALHQPLIDAPYEAAKCVFDTAVNEDVDFVVLSGGVLDPRRAGPRGPLFLIEQFERLEKRGIHVYWAGGEHDTPARWPSMFHLPDNVTFFPVGQALEVLHEQESGVPLALITGMTAGALGPIDPTAFARDAGGLYTIAVAHGTADVPALAARRIHYWALGGHTRRRTPSGSPRVVHWPGTIQGRSPSEVGVFGCSIVHVDGDDTRIATMPASVMQWRRERLTVSEQMRGDDLILMAGERLETLLQTSADMPLLLTWEVEGRGPLLRELANDEGRRGGLRRRFLREMGELGNDKSAGAWTVELKTRSPEVLPGEFYKQQTVLGDYLRTVSQYQMNATQPIDLSPFVSSGLEELGISHLADLRIASVRERVLRDAALLGVDLLLPETSGGNG